MIAVGATPSETALRGVAEDLRAAIRGDVWFDRATRAVYATDASNYRQVPIGIVCPLDADDVIDAMRICAEHDVPVLARGAGTSLAGQAVNVAVILDTSRHMRPILEIDPERRIARVQPGVVLDDLRRAAEVHGLTFGPDPATHAWCTLGGMLGNDSVRHACAGRRPDGGQCRAPDRGDLRRRARWMSGRIPRPRRRGGRSLAEPILGELDRSHRGARHDACAAGTRTSPVE